MRDLVTIDDLSVEEINTIFDLADQFLETGQWKVHGRRESANQYILSTLFYEPSTRTRFSFESAMLRLGGHILSSADATTTSAAKGETIADTVRVLHNYADVIVIRHPLEGAARVAAEFSDVPVINAGDGAHEHPTQTLCDLYTLRREKKSLKGLNVLLCGDLKNGRTVHSLVYALARFGADIHIRSAPGFGLPEHVSDRLKNKYLFETQEANSDDVDAVYRAPDSQSHLFTLDVSVSENGRTPKREHSRIDAFYVTRLQLERLNGDQAGHYPKVDARFLRKKQYSKSSVLHPLPRVDELGYDLDQDDRGVYFKQAAYGVPVRMALISALLNLDFCFTSDANWKPYDYETYSHRSGLPCPGPRCVTNDKAEQRYLTPKFWIVKESEPVTLRCVYCEYEAKPDCVGDGETRKLTNSSDWRSIAAGNRVFFANATEARGKGFHYPRSKVRPAASG